jgi:hypothetical protein
MNKKKYIKPQIDLILMDGERLLAGSVTFSSSTNGSATATDASADNSGALGKGTLWDDEE